MITLFIHYIKSKRKYIRGLKSITTVCVAFVRSFELLECKKHHIRNSARSRGAWSRYCLPYMVLFCNPVIQSLERRYKFQFPYKVSVQGTSNITVLYRI